LRDRAEDVVQLAQHFLEQACVDFGRKPMKLTQRQVSTIKDYNWPGNIRELKSLIERAVILSQGNVLRLDQALPNVAAQTDSNQAQEFESGEPKILNEKEMKSLQKTNLLAALKQTDWRVSGNQGAAELLGVRPTTLADRIRTLGIVKPR
jgi:DNA-binding NtrC family response regulator